MTRSIALAAAAAVLAAGTVAVASIPDGDGVIHACVAKSSKKIRLIDPTRSGRRGRCRASETPLTWNRTGPRGATGLTGPRGPAGARGAAGPQGPPGRAAGAVDPDPLLGSYALMFAGATPEYAAPVRTIEDCRLNATVVRGIQAPIPPKNLAEEGYETCVLELGLNLSPALRQWIGQTIAGTFSTNDLALVRLDAANQPYLRLQTARVLTFTTPALTATSTEPAFLRLELTAERIESRSGPVPKPPAGADLALHPIVPSLTTLKIGGSGQDTTAIAPWRFSVSYGENPPPTELAFSDLAVRVPEADTGFLATYLVDFAQQGNNGPAQEKDAALALFDRGATPQLTVEGHTGIFHGDLAPRADGTRAYRLYTESASLTGP